jgi:MFS family permease
MGERTGAATEDVVSTGLRRTFASLRVRNFRLFIAGQFVSTTGTWMQLVAQPWLVLQLTHSGTSLGIDTALGFTPMLLVGAWGGVLADRYDNRRLQIITQVAYACVATVLFALVATDVVRLWMVYSLSFLTGCVSVVDFPTRQSFYLDMVGPEQLTNAMSLNTATFTGTRIIGPAIAGVMIAALHSTGPVFLVNAISYSAVVVALLAMRPSELHPRQPVPRAKGQIRDGIRYVWRTPGLRLPMAVMLAVFLFSFNWSVLLPLLAVRDFHGDAETYGVIMAMFGVGSLVGALTLAGRAKRPDSRRVALFAVALGALTIALSVSSFPVALVIAPFAGAAGIGFAISGNATLQLTASSSMRGRVMALYSVIFLGSTPLGGPIAGWIGEHAGGRRLGPRIGLAGGGVIAIAAGVAGLLALRKARSLEAAEPVREATAAR